MTRQGIQAEATKNVLSSSQSHLDNIYYARDESLPQISIRDLNKATDPLVPATDVTIPLVLLEAYFKILLLLHKKKKIC